MNYYELIKMYGAGKPEAVMWKATKEVSEFLDDVREAHEEKFWRVMKRTYAAMVGEHYNKEFGEWRIAQMFYKDKQGNVHHAPHWTEAQYKEVYEASKAKLKNASYTCWDMAVTLEMMWTDNVCMLREWWPNATPAELDGKMVDMALNYLNDDDDADGKIWMRFEG